MPAISVWIGSAQRSGATGSPVLGNGKHFSFEARYTILLFSVIVTIRASLSG
jgi:hypothetical protein